MTKIAVTDLPQPVYIAGPMSNLPRFNYPAFAEAEELITECGASVFNPTKLVNTAAEYDEIMASVDGTYSFASGKTWGDFIIPSLKLIIDQVGSIVFLKGWQDSRGARLEAVTALICGKPCYTYPYLTELTAVDIATTLVPDDLFDGDNDVGE